MSVRYVTHQFAHAETMERARRWLIEAGFDRGRIEVHHHGIPRMAVAVEPGQAAEVERIIDAAESSDPDGSPSVWDVVRQQHIYPEATPQGDVPEATHSESFVIGWRPQDSAREVSQQTTEDERQWLYRQGRD
jgi:hypothetical protein